MGLFVTYCCYTVIISTVSYEYVSYLYYREIHLRRYILCYCLLNFYDYVIFIMSRFKLSWNYALIKII